MVQDSFLRYLKFEKRYSPHTITSYTNDLTQFFTYLEKNYQITDITVISHLQIRSWLVQLMQEKITPRSINRKISTLKSFFKFCVRNKQLEKDPMRKVLSPKTSKRLPVFVEQKNIRQVLDEFKYTDDYVGARNKMIIELFYATGMRLSELINIKLTDIDFYSGQLKVLGKGNKERLLPFNEQLKGEMKKYLAVRAAAFEAPKENYYFLTDTGNKMYARGVYRIVNDLLKGFTTIDKKSPHVLRHTFATHLLNNGAEINAIKELLGHASLAATQVYTHNTIEKLKEVYKQAHPKA
jgi:integrase/recombinase XerC